MTDQRVRLYRIDEPTNRSRLIALLPEAYRNRAYWPVYVNGVQYQGMTVLLFSAPRGSGVRGGVSRWGHPSDSVVTGTGLMPTQVRTWAIHDTTHVTDLTDTWTPGATIEPDHDLTLPETAFRPTIPSLRVGEHVPATEPVTEGPEPTPSDVIAQYERDVAMLSSMLIEEAENREWCSEYEEFVDAFNSTSQTVKLSARLRDATWQVEVTQTRRLRVRVDRPFRANEGVPTEAIESDALDIIGGGGGDVIDQNYETHSVVRY